MSWLSSSLTQSVTGKITQIGGQLKDILSETAEDVVDPNAELKVSNDRLKEKEKHIEVLQMECARWQDESNELTLKCRTYEAQLEQCQNDFRQQLLQKESQIIELRNQLNSNSSMMDNISPGYQKSSLMEEFEVVMPSSELNDYIHLQREIKRLKEDNTHLHGENKELLHKVKSLEATVNPNSQLVNSDPQQMNELKKEINSLRSRLEQDKDQHQADMIAIQESYKQKMKQQSSEYEDRVDSLSEKISQLELELNKWKSGPKPEAEVTTSITTSKSDDGWCINEEEIKDIDLEAKVDYESLLKEKDNQIEQLKLQVETFESDLDQANNVIQKLKSSSRSNSQSPASTHSSSNITMSLNNELNEKLTSKEALIEELNQKIDLFVNEKAIMQNKLTAMEDELTSNENVLSSKDTELAELQSQVDQLKLELKQHVQNMHQEKMLQMQDEKQDKQEFNRLRTENTELRLKIDEKLSEIKLLGDQINELNGNLNSLKTNDSALFTELKTKTEQFLSELNTANDHINTLKKERDEMVEQRKQFEFVLDEKTRECSQLKTDLQKHLQHIAGQSKAIDKLQADLKQMEDREQSQHKEDQSEQLKTQYNQLYSYLEQKNQESLNYYNEIQRLNQLIAEQNRELLQLKSVNEKLSEQYDNLVSEFQEEQKMVEDLNQQTAELTNTLLSTTNALQQSGQAGDFEDNLNSSGQSNDQEAPLPPEQIAEAEKKYLDLISVLEERVVDLEREKQDLLEQNKTLLTNQQTELSHLDLEKRISDLERENRDLAENKLINQGNVDLVSDLERRISDLDREKQDLLAQNTTLLMQGQQSETDKGHLDLIADFKHQIADLEREKQDLLEQNKTIAEIKSINEGHIHLVADLERRISDLEREKQDLINENKTLLTQNETKQVEFERNYVEVKMGLERQITDLEREKQDIMEHNKTVLTQLEAKFGSQQSETEKRYMDHITGLQQRINDLEKEKQDINEHNKTLLMQVEAKLGSQQSETEKRYMDHIAGLQQRIVDLEKEKQDIVEYDKTLMMQLETKLNGQQAYYENIIRNENENFKVILQNEEQQRAKMTKEADRLREHLVEMSDNYTKEAVQAEDREKQLRMALNDAQTRLQQHGTNLENSNKDLEIKLDQLMQQTQDLKSEKEKLKEKLKQAEESLNHQEKITKNLEMVLERVQNEKDGQYSLEIAKYQQTIKEQAVSIHNLQVDAQSYQKKIDDLKEKLDARDRLELQIMKKDELIKSLQAQIGTKDALIESIEKRANEIQKVNDSFIEKEIIKNLIIGYIKITAQQEKKQVLKLISTMLNFSASELEIVENSGEQSRWFGMLKSSTPSKLKQPTVGGATASGDKSFTELLIQYVDRESKPKLNLKFDLNDSAIAQTNKKTDNPLLMNDQELNNSESAIKFFNNSLISSTANVATDLNLVNRSSPFLQLPQSTTSVVDQSQAQLPKTSKLL